MRWNLLKTYDKIYTIDLHGNAKKKEVCPDGSPDQNVFDIMQGVAITIFVKTGKKKSNDLGEVFHYDLYGKRNLKYDFLWKNDLGSVNFEKLKPQKPFLFFVPKNNEGKESYDAGFGIDELFPTNVTGIVTARDSVVIDMNENELLNRINKFTDTQHTDDEIRNWLFPNKKEGKYLIGDSRGWKLAEARNKILDNDHKSIIKDIDYRPFDTRKIYYSADMVDWGREKYMQHIVDNKNYAFVTARQSTTESWSLAQISKNMIDNRYHFSYKGIPTEFPLYLYPENDGQQTIGKELKRKPNLNQEIVNKIATKLDLTSTNEKEQTKGTLAPIDILDYIYAVLHSPTYREKYKEFLKIDFPRVAYPKDEKTFWDLVKLGKEVREIHLLESKKVEDYITSYEMAEDAENDHNVITTKIGKKDWEIIDTEKQLGRIWINESKYFNNISVSAWEFYIGGYQPAQKWLKDRKERELKFEDILHYQKIIVALTETDRIMKEIDKIEIE